MFNKNFVFKFLALSMFYYDINVYAKLKCLSNIHSVETLK